MIGTNWYELMNLDALKSAIQSPHPLPLHAKLRDALLHQIEDGRLQAGELLPSERVLSDALNVSRSTVRQAVGALIQAERLQSVPGKGTFVLAKTYINGRGQIALIVSRPNFHFFYPQLAAAFETAVRQAGYGLVMSLHNDRVETLLERLDELVQAQSLAGIALVPPRFGDLAQVVAKVKSLGVPLVFIGRTAQTHSVPSVAVDNVQIGLRATQHLIQLGHTHILHIGFTDYSTGIERADGYRQAMTEAGLSELIDIRPITEPPSNDDVNIRIAQPARQLAAEILAAENRPTAIFCFNDVTAMGVYKAARDLDIAIPDQLSLVSVDNLPTVLHFEVPLTTFALPSTELGQQAADLLLNQLRGTTESPHQQLQLPAQFMPRQSAVQFH